MHCTIVVTDGFVARPLIISLTSTIMDPCYPQKQYYFLYLLSPVGEKGSRITLDVKAKSQIVTAKFLPHFL